MLLVGTGRMGIAYARYLANRVPGAALYAVADVRAEFGAARGVTDYRDLLGDEKVDAIVVMTPTKLHKEVLVAAARGQGHLLRKAALARPGRGKTRSRIFSDRGWG